MPINLQVLLVDDDTDDQEFFQMALKAVNPDAGCICAKDGAEAIEILQQVNPNPDIIFMDINMPRMNGVECLVEIKKMPAFRDIPVFMYSTSATPAMVEITKNAGAAGFLKKEIHIKALQDKLRETLFGRTKSE